MELHPHISKQLSGELLVEEELAEAVDADRNRDGPSPVEELRDAGTDRRSLLGRSCGKMKEPAALDRGFQPGDTLEVDGPLHVDAPFAEAPAERHAPGHRQKRRQEILLHRLLCGRELEEGLLERKAVPHVDEVEEGD